MKKSTLTVLCLLLALVTGLCGFLFLRAAPTGVYNPQNVDRLMESCLRSLDRDRWRELSAPVWTQELTPFEDCDTVYAALFDAAAEEPLTFRRDSERFSMTCYAYILSAGDRDLCRVELTGQGADLRPTVREVLLSAETRTLSITAPSQAQVSVNGAAVSEAYLTEENVPYEDMSELERRFDAPPHAVRYEIPGFCAGADVTASVNGEACTLLRSDGTDYRFEPADARAYSFRFRAPTSAAVTVSGAVLTEADRSSEDTIGADVDLSEEQRSLLPRYAVYEATGLYSEPVVTVTDSDGPLTAVEENGVLTYGSTSLWRPGEEAETVVRGYLEAYCRFGAHILGYTQVAPFVVPDGELYQFLVNAQPSLIWINGERVDFHDVSVGECIPLGDAAFLCAAHVSCTTVTYYETQELELDYQLLCVLTDQGWRVADMAYE